MSPWYDWVKALHIISVVAWMAGMLYLPRLFIYHAGATSGSELSETLKIMERRLYRFIMGPAVIAVLITGGMMASNWGVEIFHQGWFHVKLTAVIAMLGMHHGMGIWRRRFEQDRNTKSARYYRIWNEVPTVLLIVIVIMVVVKPF